MNTVDWKGHLIDFVLIIVGILIALQINNIHEEQKNNKLIKSSLDALLVNLNEDLKNFEEHLQFNKEVKNDIDYLFQLKTDPNYKSYSILTVGDSIFYGALEHSFVATTTTFETMESGGHFQLLNEQGLVRQIFSYYNNLNNLKEITATNNQFIQLVFEPFLYHAFELRSMGVLSRTYFPGDFRELKKDNLEFLINNVELENMMISRLYRLESEINKFEEAVDLAHSLIEDIEHYLANK